MSEGQPEKQSRRERRAKAQDSSSEEIKDRNQKLRAEAIARRKKSRNEPSVTRPERLARAERVDDALTRSADKAQKAIRDNFRWLQWLIVASIVGSMAYLVIDYRNGIQAEARGHELGAALEATFGRLTTAQPLTPSDRGLVDLRPEYETTDKKLEAALSSWKALEKSDRPELTWLGKLGRAGILYDQKKYAEARSAYEEVRDDPRGARFAEIRARAAEGAALCLEAEGRLDDARKALGRLKDLGGESALLAAYHLARIDYAAGQVDAAKQGLASLLEKLAKKRGAGADKSYLDAAAEELQKTVDPSAARPSALSGITPEQLEELQRQLEAARPRAPSSAPTAPELPPAPLSSSSAPLDIPVDPLDTPPSSAPAPAPNPAASDLEATE